MPDTSQPVSEFKSKSGLKRIISAVSYSIDGLCTAWKHEHAFRQELMVAIPGTVVALLLPAAGWGVATALGLDTPLAVGLILVACCPGGTASNVVTYIARADVPLSVLMTTCTTIGAVVSFGPRLVTMTAKVAPPRVCPVRSLSTTRWDSASTTAGSVSPP